MARVVLSHDAAHQVAHGGRGALHRGKQRHVAPAGARVGYVGHVGHGRHAEARACGARREASHDDAGYGSAHKKGQLGEAVKHCGKCERAHAADAVGDQPPERREEEEPQRH